MREAHKALLDSLKPEGKIIFFQAPTGYGKTSFTPSLYNEVGSKEGPPALIHVLPLKAIVEQAYNDFSNALKGVNVGVQAHGIIGGKSPYLAPPLTVTTFDSFTLNFIGANVAEKGIGHYLVPKAMIASSAIVLDEAHLPLHSGDNHYATSMLAEVYALALWRNPVIIETATLPAQALSLAIRQLPPRLNVEIEVIEPVPDNAVDKCKNSYNSLKIRANCVSDPDYYVKAEPVKWRYKRLQGDPTQTIINLAQTGLRVFRAVDSVQRAINEYQQLVGILGSDNVALLHSRLTPRDRAQQLKKVGRGAQVLVGTSAVEAGVNVSYDVLITDVPWGGGAPLSLLQRMGRINRYNESPVATVYLVDAPSQRAQKAEKVQDLINYLIKVEPNPRVPYDTATTRGYKDFLDKFSKSHNTHNIKVNHWYTIKDLALRSLKPYEVVKGLESAMEEACGLIRGTLLVPIIPDPEDLGISKDELREDTANYIFPVDHRLLLRVVQRNNGKVKALVVVEVPEDIEEYSSKVKAPVVEASETGDPLYELDLTIKDVDEPGSSCKDIVAHMLRHGIAAYVASQGLYKPETGLLVDKESSRGGTPNV